MWPPPLLLRLKPTQNLTGLPLSLRATLPAGFVLLRLRGRQWRRFRPLPRSRRSLFKRSGRSKPLRDGTLTRTLSRGFPLVCLVWTVCFRRTPLRNSCEVKLASARFPTSTSNDSSTKTSSVSSKAVTVQLTWTKPRCLVTFHNWPVSKALLTSPKSLELTRRPFSHGTSVRNWPWLQVCWLCGMLEYH